MHSYTPNGQHILADLYGIEADRLNHPETLEQLLKAAACAAGATILSSHFHHFGPGQGVTGVVLLAESHISIHTWPENGYAALDLFMCGASQPELALTRIATNFCATQVRTSIHQRGQIQTNYRSGAKALEPGIAVTGSKNPL